MTQSRVMPLTAMTSCRGPPWFVSLCPPLPACGYLPSRRGGSVACGSLSPPPRPRSTSRPSGVECWKRRLRVGVVSCGWSRKHRGSASRTCCDSFMFLTCRVMRYGRSAPPSRPNVRMLVPMTGCNIWRYDWKCNGNPEREVCGGSGHSGGGVFRAVGELKCYRAERETGAAVAHIRGIIASPRSSLRTPYGEMS
jgi:hypothetical protein